MKNREIIFYNRVEKLLAIIANALVVDNEYMDGESKIYYKNAINDILEED